MLLGSVIGKILSGEGKIPSVEEAYSYLFADRLEEMEQARQDEINAANFLQFAAQHNLKYKKGGEI